ncbi:MAG: glycosyltransferase family 2 protein [Gallionellaceae bacterium]|nr:MAG: glycosyltransferase family 2 protein [Gallionellaceae bacterium]
MTRPLLSIIIPTRSRADVLAATLATLVMLKRPDIEFVISDNASTDATEQTVRQFADARIRYVRAPSRLPMAKNFELGLQHATGEYVTTMGDDDFIVEENLELAIAAALEEQCELVYWHRAFFYWGSYQDSSLSGSFSLPGGRGHYAVNPHVLLGLALLGALDYMYMPSIYNSLCKRSFLQRYYRHLRGQYFPDYVVSMDVFSALAFSSLSPSVLFQQSPASVSGISHHSNGMSIYTGGDECEKFAQELGFNDGAVILPEAYKGLVRPLTNLGLSQLSVLTDYCNTVGHLLNFSYPFVPRDFMNSNMFLRRLHLEGHVEIRDDSELFARIVSLNNSEPLLRNDQLIYFFNLWSIPAPQSYAGRFDSAEANVWHLANHLATIGFNAAK